MSFWNLLFLLGSALADTEFSISGLSSGAYFAVQMEVAYSATCLGAGVIAGGPYYCSQGSLERSSSDCMLLYDLIDITTLVNYTETMADQGLIDPTSNLANHNVFLLSGLLDTLVNQGVVKKLQTYLETYISAGNIVTEYSLPAENAFITDFYGAACAYLGVPYMNNCLYDSAGQILTTIYGPLHAKGSSDLSHYYSFGQKEYFSALDWEVASMADTGYLYVPAGCIASYANCKVHIVAHGCGQNYLENLETVIHFAGYNEWAETNDIVILYPQAAISVETNPLGCFDWWGYTNSDYALKRGIQTAGVYAMVQTLPSLTQMRPLSS